MKKITDFIVKGRYFFLVLFIILAGLGLFLSTKVSINEDIMKYLPVNSETKIGKNIMENEFIEQDSSILNVMFKGLSNSEKKDILKKLQNIEGVSSVDYQNTDEYNKDHYTLYVLHVDDYDHSKTATNVYHYVLDHFKSAFMSGSIYEENKPILQEWIVVIAISFAMIILIILSDSYVEPWLYLIAIGIAVFINKGTNIMFDSISSITNSIVAILQLALSMDYSIMLSNRYKQEKEKNPNKIEAMKEALYQSFKAISSSSVTTIVGLIALVFMSFTIGKDLGFVLAKGVLFSLASIFFCLPALLLIFDHLIAITKKKSPTFNLTKLGKLIYKTRLIQAIFIVVLLIGSSLLKGNIHILYTDSEQDKVGAIFPATNQMAIVYNNQYEEIISHLCKSLEKDQKIDQVLCYSNTINEKLAYDELNNKLKDLGQNVTVDDNLIKTIYYHYYHPNEDNKMTLEEFISFIKSNINTNDQLNGYIDQDTRDRLNLLENFTSSILMNQERTPKEIANILGMTEEEAENILVYYHSKHVNTTMTIKEFVHFMLQDIVTDSKYSYRLDQATISKLKQLQNFTDISTINKKMTASELSQIFGIDENLIQQIFLFYRTTIESSTTMTLHDFATIALEMSDEAHFDSNTIQLLGILQKLSDYATVSAPLDQTTMQQNLSTLGFQLDDDIVSLLYYYYQGFYSETSLTLYDFATSFRELAKNPAYQSYFTDPSVQKLLTNIPILTKFYNISLPKSTLYQRFDIDPQVQEIVDTYMDSNMTPQAFVDKLLEIISSDETISSQISNDVISELKVAQYVMANVTTKYSVNTLFSALATGSSNISKSMISVVYGYHDHPDLEDVTISIQELISFLNENQSDPLLAPFLSGKTDDLTLSYQIVHHTNTLYNEQEISQIIGIDVLEVHKIFGVYDYNHQKTALTPLDFANLILDYKDHSLLAGKLTKSAISELSLVKEVMDATIYQKEYSSSQLSSLFGLDDETMCLLFSLYDFKYLRSNQDISLYNDVHFIVKNVMNDEEYAASFDDETREKLTTILTIMENSIEKKEYTSKETFEILSILSDHIQQSLLDVAYMYYGSNEEYDLSWKMTIEEFVNYLNKEIITDYRFDKFMSDDERTIMMDARKMIDKSKKLLVSDHYSRVILNTKYAFEDEATFRFINQVKDQFEKKEDIYLVGNSPMAVEMSQTFNDELNKITILTMLFIFIVVAITFKDLIIPLVLVFIIQTAVYLTMSAISLTGGSVYFISLLIVQAILMGATIDYAIVYTSYYRESRQTMGIQDSIINAYNKSIHTIISSSSILIIVTLVVAHFASAIAAKICETISQGTFAAVVLILFLLPGVLATTDKFICRKGYYKELKRKL